MSIYRGQCKCPCAGGQPLGQLSGGQESMKMGTSGVSCQKQLSTYTSLTPTLASTCLYQPQLTLC